MPALRWSTSILIAGGSGDRWRPAGPRGPGQRQRLLQLAPGTWDQALAGVLGGGPGRADDDPGRSATEIAIYPDVTWLAARSLREHSASHRAPP